MKVFVSRMAIAVLAALAAWMLLVGAAPAKTTVLAPDKLVIASTTDVKGKTSLCG